MSDLLTYFESNTCAASDSTPSYTMIFDGPATVHILLPKGSKTFKGYSTQMFVPYIRKQLQNYRCVDLIWDIYPADGLKVFTRQKRGFDINRWVTRTGTVPDN